MHSLVININQLKNHSSVISTLCKVANNFLPTNVTWEQDYLLVTHYIDYLTINAHVTVTVLMLRNTQLRTLFFTINISSASCQNKTFYIFSSVFPL